MATGPESSGFQTIGKQYQTALERAGEQLRLVETAGSIENLALLRDPNCGVKVALIQDGTIGKEDGTDLESLGTLFYEPVWIFLGSEVRELTPSALRGRKVSIGSVGSGTHALLFELLKRNELDQQVAELLALEPQAAADELLAGRIDMAAFVAQWDSPIVRQLITDERETPAALTSPPRGWGARPSLRQRKAWRCRAFNSFSASTASSSVNTSGGLKILGLIQSTGRSIATSSRFAAA